jgi:SPP1 gp7 family putative phage head morphogenesis protein
VHIKIGHLLHSGITGPGHAVERMRKRKGRTMRPVRPSHKNELWYRAELQRLVKHLRARTQAVLIPALASLFPKQATDGALFAVDSPNESSAKAQIKNLAREFGGIDKLAGRLAFGAAARSRDAVDDRLASAIRASVSVDVKPFLTNNPRITSATHAAVNANVDLIKSIPEQYFDKITNAVETHWAEGMRWESLTDRIQEIGDITETRAAFIARDQTAKMNSSFNQVRQTDLGIEQYEWSTSEDERVRDSHADLDGEVFSWDNPPIVDDEPVNPGMACNCRCVALPHLDLDNMEAQFGFGAAA